MGASFRPPPSVAGLRRLQRACFLIGEEVIAAALPTGPWADSLRQLGAPFNVLLLSGELLAAAGQLERLGVLGGDLAAAPDAASERLWCWCAAHPPLRQLHIELERLEPIPPSILAVVARLTRAQPALLVECHHGPRAPFSDAFYHEV